MRDRTQERRGEKQARHVKKARKRSWDRDKRYEGQ